MTPSVWYVPVFQPLSQITQFTSADIQIPAQHPIHAEPLVDLIHSSGDDTGVDRVNYQVFESSDRRLVEDRQKRGVREGLRGTVTVSFTQSYRQSSDIREIPFRETPTIDASTCRFERDSRWDKRLDWLRRESDARPHQYSRA
jgi:hypothetical protein